MKLKNSYLIAGLKKLKTDLKPMTFSQKVDHIWSYYKEYMFVAAMVLLICVAFISGCVNANKQILFSGLISNVTISQEGYDYLSVRYEEKLEAEKGQLVELAYVNFEKQTTDSEIDASYAAMMKAIAMTSAGTLDYLVMDEYAMEFYINQDVFMDLRIFFTEEEMEQWKSKVIYVQNDGSDEMYPVAINISELDFKKDTMGDGPAYLGFTARDERVGECRQFWEYLNAWQSSN